MHFQDFVMLENFNELFFFLLGYSKLFKAFYITFHPVDEETKNKQT